MFPTQRHESPEPNENPSFLTHSEGCINTVRARE